MHIVFSKRQLIAFTSTISYKNSCLTAVTTLLITDGADNGKAFVTGLLYVYSIDSLMWNELIFWGGKKTTQKMFDKLHHNLYFIAQSNLLSVPFEGWDVFHFSTEDTWLCAMWRNAASGNLPEIFLPLECWKSQKPFNINLPVKQYLINKLFNFF